MKAAADGDAYAIRAIDRAIDVLTTFTIEDSGLSLTEIAERTKLSKPTAFRILASLKRRGFIEQDGDRGDYALGFEIVTLAGVRKRQTNVWEAALPYMRRIRDSVDETVLLCVRVGDDRYVLDQVESTRPIRRVAKVGERVPLYVGAGSRVLLAALDDAEIDAYLRRTELVKIAPATLTDPKRLRQEVASVRELGYAIGVNERSIGGNGVAVGVRDYTSETVAALQITVPTERWTDELRARSIDVLLDVARELSAHLGDRPRAAIRDVVDRATETDRSRKAAGSSAEPRRMKRSTAASGERR